MNKCQNPICGREIRPGKKYCSASCGGAVRQRDYRQRHRKAADKAPGVFRKKSVAENIAASMARLKARHLFVEEKNPPGSTQSPPPPSKEFTAEMEKRRAQLVAIYEKADLLIRQERTARNVRSIYLNGMTFRLAYLQPPQGLRRNNNRILTQERGEEFSDPAEWECVKKYLENLFEPYELTCPHKVSWRHDCDACAIQLDYKDVAGWNQEQANLVLARLGFSLWAGKSKSEAYLGHGRTVEGIHAAGQGVKGGRRGRRKGIAPDSFEPTGQEAPPGQGQIDSRPDRNYAGKKSGLGSKAANEPLNPSEVLYCEQSGMKQNLSSPERAHAALDVSDNQEQRILNDAHEKIKESSSDAEVARIMNKAEREIDALAGSGTVKAGGEPAEDKDSLPEERPEEPEVDGDHAELPVFEE
jgi:hypothetical protein